MAISFPKEYNEPLIIDGSQPWKAPAPNPCPPAASAPFLPGPLSFYPPPPSLPFPQFWQPQPMPMMYNNQYELPMGYQPAPPFVPQPQPVCQSDQISPYEGQDQLELHEYDNAIIDTNAQQILPATARVLVGNLPYYLDDDTLTSLLKARFTEFGHNFVHVEGRGKWPVAFVQFTKDEHAQRAINRSGKLGLYNLKLRVELCKAGQQEKSKKLRCKQRRTTDAHTDNDKVKEE
ncbi:uncharacterized protein BJX67DRAFT_152153 [Aspergillus lucknowensis]|uniref:RRM domain-containing protein n=1 Tax=Aspergillus lucknowensis TaxID=176173 RepID=A0ABR4LN94_9EURO